MTAVITGASGQLGSAFARIWPEAEFWRRPVFNLADPSSVIWHQVLKAQADVLINAAAYTAVDQAETEPDKAQKVNAEGVRTLAHACYEAGTRLVQVSTDYVFSGRPPLKSGWRPEDKTYPASIYGGTKQLGEQAALAYSDNLVVRTSWLFGNGHNFVRTMRRLGRQQDVVEVVDDQLGRPTFAPDLAEAIRFLATSSESRTGIWHVQNSGPVISWAEFAEAIFDFDGLDCKVLRVSSQEYAAKARATGKPYAQRPENSLFDLSGLTEAGYAMRDWREALQEYMRKTPPPT